MPTTTERLQVRRMLRGASDFAAKAMAYVVSELDEGSDPPNRVFHDYAQLVHSLEVHFLFPNLPDKQRDTLTRISQLNSMIQAYVAEQAPGPDPQGAQRHASRIERLQSELLSLRHEASQASFSARMTSVQRRLLASEFLGKPKGQ